MLIISNCGNLYGKDVEFQNSTNSMEKALSLGFHVKLDFWGTKAWDTKLNDQPCFGDDCAKFHISEELIFEYCDRLWLNAKSGSALETALCNNLQCFHSHIDSFSMVSTGFLWNSSQVHRKAIIVMPEDNDKGLFDNFEKMPTAVCTNYPILLKFVLRHANPLQLFKVGIKLDKVYDSICMPKTFLPMQNENDLCLGIISKIISNDVFPIMLESLITFSQNLMEPHFTWMRLTPFRDSKWDTHLFSEAFRFGLDFIPDGPVKILFHRVLICSDSILIVGYPNFDISEFRNAVNKKCIDDDIRDTITPYASQFVHSTIVRFREPVELKLVQTMTSIIELYLPFEVILEDPKLQNCTIRGFS